MVGAGTLRDEGYDVPKIPLVVVSRSGEVPDNLREAPEGRILMATTASADGLAESRSLLGDEQVLVLGDDAVDLVELKSRLAARGWVDQLCEGGPGLFAAALEAGVVDELCLTIVPRLLGGDFTRITAGADLDVTPDPPLAAGGGRDAAGPLAGRRRPQQLSSRLAAAQPRAESSALLKAGRSSGLREVMRLPSSTTSSSTQSPPALRMSVWRLGHDVTPLAGQDAGLDEGPRGVADRGDGLARVDERLDEGHRLLVHPQGVGVGDAAGEDQGVVVVDRGVGDGGVDRAGLGLVEVVEELDLAGLRGQQLRRVAGAGHGVPRVGELDCLDALGCGQECDALGHASTLSRGEGLDNTPAGGAPAASLAA